jgi:hypothetical protein
VSKKPLTEQDIDCLMDDLADWIWRHLLYEEQPSLEEAHDRERRHLAYDRVKQHLLDLAGIEQAPS